MNIKRIALSFILALALTASAASADMWFHVNVVEAGNDNTRVSVNLPFSMIEQVMPMISAEEYNGGALVIDDEDFDASKLRNILDAVRNSPEATFAEVETNDEHFVVYREGDYLRVSTAEASADGTEIDARLPLSVVEALLSGPPNTLDLAAAIRALADHGPGDLITVRDGETQVRVWIDHNPEGRR